MTIRLYPASNDPKLIERLAKVEPGAYKRFRAWQTELAQITPDDLAARLAHTDQLENDPELSRLENFRLFGLGCLTSTAQAVLAQHGWEASSPGQVNDPQISRELLATQLGALEEGKFDPLTASEQEAIAQGGLRWNIASPCC